MYALGSVINLVLFCCIILLIARFILDWIQFLARDWRARGIVAVLCEIIYVVTDPPLRAVRKIIPGFRIGAASLDLSPMVLLIGIYILMSLNAAILLR